MLHVVVDQLAGDIDVDLALDGVARSRVLRIVYGAFGFVFLSLGIAGWFLPGIPGTINLLIALWLFSMSSRRMYRWMLTNKYFGQELRDYKSGLGIPRKVKVFATTSIVLAVGFSAGFVFDNMWVRGGLVALGAYGVWFILTRPTREVELARRAAAAHATA
jgi:uncharacterized membrane protein YbaN (DUF454 family)